VSRGNSLDLSTESSDLGGVPALTIPSNLAESLERYGDEKRRNWVARLPEIVDQFADGWSLHVGAPFEPGGECSWVAPVRDAQGQTLVLKVGYRHVESEHEAAALQEWAGEAAVLLHDAIADGETLALLLEACDPGTLLREEPEDRQDEIVAGLLRRLWREPSDGHPFRPLREMADEWADECATNPNQVLDPGIVRDGLSLFRELPRSADSAVLLTTDLHAGNILAARREPWLVIDPKPYVGDPCYDVTQHMLNCQERLTADPFGLAHRMADLAGLDRDRVRQWLFARCVQESPGWPGMGDVALQLARR
jgi:streptomycin 6-kinase